MFSLFNFTIFITYASVTTTGVSCCSNGESYVTSSLFTARPSRMHNNWNPWTTFLLPTVIICFIEMFVVG